MRFILIAFAFMAWAFYELSGGGDFDAEAVRAARMADLDMDEPVVKAPAEPVVIVQAPTVVVDTDPPKKADVTRVALNLTTLEEVSSVAPKVPEIAPQTDVTTTLQETVSDVPQNVGIVTSSIDTPAIIPSLIDPTDGITQSVVETVTETAQSIGFQDIRTVSGNRVNVRGGPGTDFGVVGRLVRGDEIKVLEDDGAGWVRFETTDGNTGGWMADFLLSDG